MNWNSDQIREDAKQRRQELHGRLAQIPIEKQKLDDEVQTIKRELIGLDQVLDGLDVMTSGPVPTPEPAGFTDKIRKLLSETSVPLVPTQIRDALEQAGVTASSSKNLLINVHTVIERIDDELEKLKRPDGKIAYRRTAAWLDNVLTARILGSNTFASIFADRASNTRTLAALAGSPGTALPNIEDVARAAEQKKHAAVDEMVRQAVGRKKNPAFYGKE